MRRIPFTRKTGAIAVSSLLLIVVCTLLFVNSGWTHAASASLDPLRRRHRPIATATVPFSPTATIGTTATATAPVGLTPTVTPTQPVGTTPTVTITPTQPTGQSGVQVFVEPAAGETVILNAINNAQTSVWVELYLLTDQNVVQALENTASRGIDVRVMLEQHPFGGSDPSSTIAALNNAGAHAQYTNPAFTLTHEKSMIIDGNTAYIMTCNLSRSALGGSSSTTNREYGIIDTNTSEVQDDINIFNADWNRTQASFTSPNLVVSPVNSRADFAALLASAKSTLIIEAEEMNDSAIEQDIVAAEQRGVQVEVILPQASGSTDSNAAGIAVLKQGGVTVREDGQYYMHAKMMVADGVEGYVGSINISTQSFDSNRELGLLLQNQTVLTTLEQTFQSDWSNSQTV